MATEIWIHIGSDNGLLPDGIKPLPEPMLTYHHKGRLTFISGQVHKRYISHQSLKLSVRLSTYYFLQIPQGPMSLLIGPWKIWRILKIWNVIRNHKYIFAFCMSYITHRLLSFHFKDCNPVFTEPMHQQPRYWLSLVWIIITTAHKITFVHSHLLLWQVIMLFADLMAGISEWFATGNGSYAQTVPCGCKRWISDGFCCFITPPVRG